MRFSTKTAALIPAAGLGTRLGEGPKALLRLGSTTLLEIVVDKLYRLVDEVIVSAPAQYVPFFEQLVGNKASIVTGGELRWQSIDNMLACTTAGTVLIQNVASPFASTRLLSAVLREAINCGASGAFYSLSVPVGILNDCSVIHSISRSHTVSFQTPQAFSRELLERYHDCKAYTFQSTAEYLIHKGTHVRYVLGEETNIKITSPLDWKIARDVIAPQLGLTRKMNGLLRLDSMSLVESIEGSFDFN